MSAAPKAVGTANAAGNTLPVPVPLGQTRKRKRTAPTAATASGHSATTGKQEATDHAVGVVNDLHAKLASLLGAVTNRTCAADQQNGHGGAETDIKALDSIANWGKAMSQLVYDVTHNNGAKLTLPPPLPPQRDTTLSLSVSAGSATPRSTAATAAAAATSHKKQRKAEPVKAKCHLKANSKADGDSTAAKATRGSGADSPGWVDAFSPHSQSQSQSSTELADADTDTEDADSVPTASLSNGAAGGGSGYGSSVAGGGAGLASDVQIAALFAALHAQMMTAATSGAARTVQFDSTQTNAVLVSSVSVATAPSPSPPFNGGGGGGGEPIAEEAALPPATVLPQK